MMPVADHERLLSMLAAAIKSAPRTSDADCAAAVDIVVAAPELLRLDPQELHQRLAALTLSAKPVVGDRFGKMLAVVPRLLTTDAQVVEVRRGTCTGSSVRGRGCFRPSRQSHTAFKVLHSGWWCMRLTQAGLHISPGDAPPSFSPVNCKGARPQHYGPAGRRRAGCLARGHGVSVPDLLQPRGPGRQPGGHHEGVQLQPRGGGAGCPAAVSVGL